MQIRVDPKFHKAIKAAMAADFSSASAVVNKVLGIAKKNGDLSPHRRKKN